MAIAFTVSILQRNLHQFKKQSQNLKIILTLKFLDIAEVYYKI